ncbi:MAG: pyridoxal-5'-phosphate-dependent protein [Alphaproteobacteria bacterium 64-11]|nr:threonine/serine dehydratase [Alphaproteobacteria bacterium]OJU07908.1 MAG: pyridoxal-5'-phosphate-dependent protein [Alphaproteobacteria bacterium 64-11]
MLPTIDDIRAAAARIRGHAVRTPLLASPVLDAHTGGRVLLKPETLQRTGSFKFRGAVNRIALIPQAERGKGVVAFSSGNHAQGVAAAAGVFGMKAVIVMPADAPRAKLEGTRSLGAEIVTYDRQTEDREAIAARVLAERGGTLIKPFDDAQLIAGQGTVGLEILEDAGARGVRVDQLLVPCGGGGLTAGIALAVGDAAKVYSVEPQNFNGMRRSLDAGAPVKAPATPVSVADSLMSPQPGAIPFAVAGPLLAGGLTVTDEDLLAAVSFALCRLKLVVEPGGAAALAALLAGKLEARDRTTVLVLSGGNADFAVLAGAVSRFA